MLERLGIECWELYSTVLQQVNVPTTQLVSQTAHFDRLLNQKYRSAMMVKNKGTFHTGASFVRTLPTSNNRTMGLFNGSLRSRKALIGPKSLIFQGKKACEGFVGSRGMLNNFAGTKSFRRDDASYAVSVYRRSVVSISVSSNTC